ncbi:MAG: histone deacetylase [Thermoguttaceae bacterium]|jgi:acetoin utilization deacetylase AcuC-like enzyme
MTLLYDDPRFLDHQTGAHPERPLRLRAISDGLRQSALAERCRRAEFAPCHWRWLNRVHRPGYLRELWALARSGGGDWEADTVVGPASFDVARLAAGATCDAVGRVVRGEDTEALCLVRPPGHHALPDQAMGFCLLNNVAVAARLAVDELGLDRVLIVDWDVHHGNGTQAAFWEDPRVGFLSIHRYPFYPGSGAADERGGGAGLGATLNLPIEFGTSRKNYLAAFAGGLQQMADRLRPQLILISAGFDAHRQDPIGNLGLESEDFTVLTDLVLEVAAMHAGHRVVSVLEGGYHPPALAECVVLHLEAMISAKQ